MKNVLGYILFGVGAYVLYEWYVNYQATQTTGTSTTTQSGQAPQLSQTAVTTNVPVTSVAPSGAVQGINTTPVSAPSSPTATPATATTNVMTVNSGLGPNAVLIVNMQQAMNNATGRIIGNADEWTWVLNNLGFNTIPSPDALGFPIVNGVRQGGQMSAGSYIAAIDSYASIPGIAGLDGLGRAYVSGMGHIGAGYTMHNGGGGQPVIPPSGYPFAGKVTNFSTDAYRYGYNNIRPTMLNMNPDASKYELATKYIN